MTSSFTKRLEILNLYGATSLAQVQSIVSHVITVTAATWAPGIWAGSEGMTLDSFTAVTGGSAHDAGLVITAVDLVNRTITVSGDSTTVANDYLFYAGYRGAEQNGLDKICTNSGTLYNISATTYNLWSGSSYSAGSAALTMSKIQSAIALAVAKGLDEKVTVLCSPKAYANLNSDLGALRRIDSDYSNGKGENGFQSIKFWGVNGEIEIVPSIYVKEGECFCFPPKRFKRLGGSDVTMKMPGMSDEQLMLQMPSNAGYELRLFSDMNLFSERPAWCVKITSITNN